jgi:hypothetical protein
VRYFISILEKNSVEKRRITQRKKIDERPKHGMKSGRVINKVLSVAERKVEEDKPDSLVSEYVL